MELSVAETRALNRILARLREGCGPINAAIEVGWSPAKLERLKKDAEFRDLCELARTQMIEAVEEVVIKEAMTPGGSFQIKQLVLYNLGRERGWTPPTQRHQINKHTTIELSDAQRDAAAIRALIMDEGVPVAALQPGGALDGIQDAEIVDG